MFGRANTPPMADWHVRQSTSGTLTQSLTVRATRLRVRKGAVVLEDTAGEPVFAGPLRDGWYAQIAGEATR